MIMEMGEVLAFLSPDVTRCVRRHVLCKVTARIDISYGATQWRWDSRCKGKTLHCDDTCKCCCTILSGVSRQLDKAKNNEMKLKEKSCRVRNVYRIIPTLEFKSFVLLYERFEDLRNWKNVELKSFIRTANLKCCILFLVYSRYSRHIIIVLR